MYFKGLTFIFSEDPPENHLKVIGGLLLKYYVLLFILLHHDNINLQPPEQTSLGLFAYL